MIKLVVSDLDGTLLDSKSEVSEVTVNTIKKYIDKGIEFAFCTGRAFAEMDHILESIPFIRYAITANGAYCFDTFTKEEIFKTLMFKKDIKKVYDVLKDEDVLFEAYIDDKIYCNKKSDDEIIEYIPIEFLNMVKKSRVLVEDMEKLIDELDEKDGAIKIHIFFTTVTDRDKVYQRIKDMPYDIVSQSFNEIEVNAKDVNKGNGVLALAQKLGVSKGECMGFGDNFNDISMRNGVGTLVAVENAVDPLKEIADYITKSNTENGVALGLDKFLG